VLFIFNIAALFGNFMPTTRLTLSTGQYCLACHKSLASKLLRQFLPCNRTNPPPYARLGWIAPGIGKGMNVSQAATACPI
jgi:hypothetical protein